MNWLQRYRLRHYFRNSVWVLPVLGIVAALASIRLFHWVEGLAGWQAQTGVNSVRDLLGTLAGSMFTFIVFLSSTLLLVVQLASAQLSPRFIGMVFRDRITRWALTLFTFTFTFTLAALLRIEGGSAPQFTTLLAQFLFLLSLGVFLFLIDHVGKRLRPSGALLAVALIGHREIRSVYPRRLSGQPEKSLDPAHPIEGKANPDDSEPQRRSAPLLRSCGTRRPRPESPGA